MSIVDAVRSRISVKIALAVALLMLVMTAIASGVITARETKQMEELTLEKAKLAAAAGARQFGEILEAAIDDERLTVADVFDRNYQLIKGWNWGDHPKFHTRYDAYTDRAALVFQDKFLDYEDFVFAVGLDENGYLPTHNTVYQKPLTGDPAKDLVGNRTKRFFNNPQELAAVRNTEPFIVQAYRRDTGETMWDVAAPIWVKGKHWGAFRVGVSMERIAAQQRSLIVWILLILAISEVVAIGTMFWIVQISVQPVVRLTAAAERLSMGEGLDEPLRTTAIDEIGHLTKAIDRLRVSMKAALSRLGQ